MLRMRVRRRQLYRTVSTDQLRRRLLIILLHLYLSFLSSPLPSPLLQQVFRISQTILLISFFVKTLYTQPAATMRSLLALLPLLPALTFASPVSVGTIHNDAAPLLSSTSSEPIPDSYIVVFKDHVSKNAATAHHSWVSDLHASSQLRKRSQIPLVDGLYQGLRHTYDIAGAILGYSGHFDEDTVEEIRRHPDACFPTRPPRLPPLTTFC